MVMNLLHRDCCLFLLEFMLRFQTGCTPCGIQLAAPLVKGSKEETAYIYLSLSQKITRLKFYSDLKSEQDCGSVFTRTHSNKT